MPRLKDVLMLTVMALLFGTAQLMAQFPGGPPPGGPPPGGGFDPDEMVKREKQNVFKAITDLSEDQKTLLDGIYTEFATSFKEIREEVMKTRDFQNMRPKMEALSKEKDDLIHDVLNEDQFAIYTGIVEGQRKQRQQNRQAQPDPNKPVENAP